MVAATKFQSFVQALGRGLHELDNNVLKVALSNTGPNAATHDELADITQISAGNGYTTGGNTVANNAYSQSGGVGTLTGDDVVFTFSGAVGPFQYIVFYDDTSTGDKLICFWDYGSALSFPSGGTFTVNFGANIFTLT